LKQQNTKTPTTQKELATQYCNEIDDYIKQLEPITTKREKILTDINRLTIINAILPIITAPTTGIIAILTQHYWITFINIISALPPIIANINKNKLNKYNDCTDLKLELTGFKGHIARLAITGELKGKIQEEIKETIQDFNETLSNYLQIET